MVTAKSKIVVMDHKLMIFPIHNGDESEYRTLAMRFRETIPPGLGDGYRDDQVHAAFSGHFSNDIAGFVEMSTDGEALYCTIYARKTWPRARWRRDRRIVNARLYYCDTQHVSVRHCTTRAEYSDKAQLVLNVARALIPKRFHFDPSFAEPVLRNLDWQRLLKRIGGS